ncbi:hypothetical protein ACJX0J_037156, partial [Zea mays]
CSTILHTSFTTCLALFEENRSGQLGEEWERGNFLGLNQLDYTLVVIVNTNISGAHMIVNSNMQQNMKDEGFQKENVEYSMDSYRLRLLFSGTAKKELGGLKQKKWGESTQMVYMHQLAPNPGVAWMLMLSIGQAFIITLDATTSRI